MIPGILSSSRKKRPPEVVEPTPAEWVTVYDATTGSFGGGDADYSDLNTRLSIDPTSLLMGSTGFTQIRVTFIGPATGNLVIQNAAFGEASGDDPGDNLAAHINYASAPTVLTFDGGSPSKTIAATTEVVSDAVTLAAPFDGAHCVVIAINHGASSETRGRVEMNALLEELLQAGDETTNTGDVTGDGLGGANDRSYGVSRIELAP